MQEIIFRPAIAADAHRCFEIESSAYGGDEAATLEKIRKRVECYPQGFLVMEIGGQIVGFINSGCTYEVVMSDTSIKELIGHDPFAPNVVVMSVVVHPAHQRRGYATLMIDRFIQQMRRLGKIAIHLMCKKSHIELYARHGFSYVRPSASELGGKEWHEMMLEL